MKHLEFTRILIKAYMNGILQRDVLTLLKKNQTIEGEFFSAKMYSDFLLIKTSSTGCLSNASLNGGLQRCSAIINYSLYGKEDSMLTLFFEVDDVPHFCKRMRMLGLDIEREWPDKAEMRDPDSRKVVIMESLL